ncbi:MAG: hypothetical protein V1768_02705 [Patescibacteria group bacterium]|nr:hypothetical protein [Patescibacteria group bacterium]MBU1160362.1 hypothetical protein [Patescibacteria group bacterium]MBU1349584.1 hypothetical protein [Patescibacteria group bacterium]MBU1420984.1 hypothetical protein [Patescibacteria group bacterium]MBU1684043.1 hypothetical protein [Patescibacteria group bacterium]
MKKEIKKSKIKSHVDYKKVEQGKTLAMWSGVIFFMFIIVLVWVINLQHSFKNIETSNETAKQLNWDEVIDGFSKTMNQIEKKYSEAKQATTTNSTSSPEKQGNVNATNTSQNIINTLENNTATSAKTISDDDVLILKNKLEKL